MTVDLYMARLGQLERCYPRVVPTLYRELRGAYSTVEAVQQVEVELTARGLPLPDAAPPVPVTSVPPRK